jgi:hypothetical protein
MNSARPAAPDRPVGDDVLAVARRIETMLAEIAYAEDRVSVFDLQQRATEMISGLHSAVDRARLRERVEDTVNARLQELDET